MKAYHRRRTLAVALLQGAGLLLASHHAAAQAEAESDTAAPASTEPGAASDADAEALIASLSAGTGGDSTDAALADVEDYSLNIYGFTDFTYTARLNDFAFASPYPSFMVGNLNLYVGAELGRGWRTLTEFRLLYVPHGSPSANDLYTAEPARIDTTVLDPADYGRPQRWGGVEIERAYLEYSAHSLLTIRGGQWLTPYGIWNVDHGSPVIIGVRRPYVVGEALIPERQTGLQLYGSHIVGSTELGYNFALSNGRGPVDAFQDLDHNKAVTARLYVNTELPVGTVSLGGTLYRGRFTDRFVRNTFATNGELGVDYIATARYEELGLSGDLRWSWDDLTLQGELIMRDTAFDDRARAASLPLVGVPPGFASDFRSIGWYVMGAYRLPWWNITPFVGGESYKSGQDFTSDTVALWGGLNVRPVPRVVLKAQYTESWFADDIVVGDDGIQAIDLQAAWSF